MGEEEESAEAIKGFYPVYLRRKHFTTQKSVHLDCLIARYSVHLSTSVKAYIVNLFIIQLVG